MKVQIAQWIVAAGGSIVAIVAVIVGYLERRQAREDDRLGQTLDYFAGGSQRRSIGISLIEGLWIKKPRHHDVIVPLVANQIVYLLLSTDLVDAHNERNLVRLFMILKSVHDFRERYANSWVMSRTLFTGNLKVNRRGFPLRNPLSTHG